jgi:hypothetical protein
MDAFTNFLSEFFNDAADWLNVERGTSRTALKWAYWGIGIFGLLSICYILYNRFEKPVSAMLLFMGGWMLLMYYWVKWFKLTETTPAWPPFVAPCPDFLTLIVSETEATEAKCVDYVGIANPNAPTPLKKASPSSIQSQINDPSYFFSSPKTVRDANGVERKATVYDTCDRVREKGLVWSGVCPE